MGVFEGKNMILVWTTLILEPNYTDYEGVNVRYTPNCVLF